MFRFMHHHKDKEETSQVAVEDLHDVDSLVAALNSEDGFTRKKAREALVAMGEPAVGPLIRAVSSSSWPVRWEAAKALGEIHSPDAAPALVKALEDDEFEVRWLAAEALIALGEPALRPLYSELVNNAESHCLRYGARRVLRALAHEGLGAQVRPVLAALEDVEPAVEVPTVAEAALQTEYGAGQS